MYCAVQLKKGPITREHILDITFPMGNKRHICICSKWGTNSRPQDIVLDMLSTELSTSSFVTYVWNKCFKLYIPPLQQIIYVYWYNFVPSRQNWTGDRFYSRGSVQWVPCNSIIRYLAMTIALTWSSWHYKLLKSLHIHIEENGDISY